MPEPRVLANAATVRKALPFDWRACMKQMSRNLLGVLALPVLLWGSAAAFSAPDEDDPDEAADVQANGGFMVQEAKYQIVQEERRRFRYQAAIEVALHTLGNTVALRHDQHEAVLKLVAEETQPLHVFGQYDHYAIMFKMSELPAAKLKSLLDERQWKLLQQQMNQSRGMESTLIEQGIIDAPKGGILKSMRSFIGEAGL